MYQLLVFALSFAIVSSATCGGGDRGDGICPMEGECCSKFGYCGRGRAYCGDNGEGGGEGLCEIDSGACLTEGECCSNYGYCGTGVDYCESGKSGKSGKSSKGSKSKSS